MKKIFLFTWLLLTQLAGQTQIFVLNENFDGDTIPLLPATWETTTISGIGFRTEDGNNSDNPGASGANNIVIRNTDSTGTYSLTSPTFSTVGLNNIKVLFTSRVSNNFLTPGSTTPLLECSVDDGQSWVAMSYTDNDANSTWAVVNDSVPISLPINASDNAGVKLRWTVGIVNDASGSYRIDDVKVFGDSSVVSVMNPEFRESVLYPNPCDNKLNIISEQIIREIEIRDINGLLVLNSVINANQCNIDTEAMASGLYVILLKAEKCIEKHQFIVR